MMRARSLVWAAAFALTGAIGASIVSTGTWSGPRYHGFAGPPIADVDGPARWSGSSSWVEFPTLSWRPVRVTVRLRAPAAADPARRTVIVSLDERPVRRVQVGSAWETVDLALDSHAGLAGGLTIRVDSRTVDLDGRGVAVGPITTRPTGIGLHAVTLLLLGAAGGLLCWLALPMAGPIRGRGTLAAGRLLGGRVTTPWTAWPTYARPIPWLLAAIPAGVLVAQVARYGVDVPFGDQWELVPLLDAWHAGTLRLADLLAYHNEHRPLVSRVLLFGLALASGWNIRLELAISVAVALGTLLILIWSARRAGGGSPRTMTLLAPVFAVLVCSTKQWENWLWGWQLTVFLNVAASVALFVLLTRDRLTARRLIGGLLAALVATYSFASGLAVWPLGAWAIVRSSSPSRRAFLALWVLVGSTVVLPYLAVLLGGGGTASVMATGLTAGVGFEILLYLAKYLGTPLFGRSVTAAVAGAAGLTVFVTMSAWELRAAAAGRPRFGFVLIGIYAMLGGVMAATGRVGMGTDQAMSSRYVTMSAPFWIALLVLIAGRPLPAMSDDRWRIVALRSLLVAIVAVAAVRASYLSFPALAQRHARLEAGRAALIAGDGDRFTLLYPDRQLVEARRATLLRLGLSVFREVTPPR